MYAKVYTCQGFSVSFFHTVKKYFANKKAQELQFLSVCGRQSGDVREPKSYVEELIVQPFLLMLTLYYSSCIVNKKSGLLGRLVVNRD